MTQAEFVDWLKTVAEKMHSSIWGSAHPVSSLLAEIEEQRRKGELPALIVSPISWVISDHSAQENVLEAQTYFLTALWSRPPWWRTRCVTWPLSFLMNSISASTTFGKNVVSDSAKMGTSGWPVIWVMSWSPLRLTTMTKFGSSS